MSLVLVLAWLASTAHAQSCAAGWFADRNGIAVAPLLAMRENPGASLIVERCYAGGENVKWVSPASGRAVLATGALRRTANGLDLEVTAITAGTFAVGQRVRAPVIEAIDGALTRYTAGRPSETERFYPYNWKSGLTEGVAEQNAATGNRNIKPAATVSIDLALPGVRIGLLYFVEAANELALVDVVTTKDAAEARLMLTTAAPSPNGDDAVIYRPLAAGQRINLSVLVDGNLKRIDDAKWGSSPPMAERIAEVPFKDWAVGGYNLPAAAYRMIAKQLAGGFDSVIIRTMAPAKWVADIFKQQGLRVYLYQYWGAVRILDKQGTVPDGVKPEWRLHETGGGSADYTAPMPSGAWQLLDVRRPEVRAFFVKAAQDAVANGWDGVFYDGSYFWADSRGRVGGAAERCPRPGDTGCMSFSYGRAKLLLQVKQAVKSVNPSAKVGILSGLRYVDQLHIADFVLREAVNVGWVKLISRPWSNIAEYGPRLSTKWLREEEPYFTGNLVWGTKSSNPLLDKSSIYWAAPNAKNIAIDVGDFYPDETVAFAKAYGDVGRYFNANRIVRISPPNALLYGVGPSLIEVKQPVTITLEHPAPAFDFTTGQYLGYANTYRLKPSDRYVIAERPGAGPIYFSGERFAWFAPSLYLTGAIRFTDPPARTADGVSVHGTIISDGMIELHSSQPPRSVLANGRAIGFRQDQGVWAFVAPKNLTELKITF